VTPVDLRTLALPLPLAGGWDRGGWTLIAIGSMEDAKLADLIRLAWRQVAPKKLLGAA